MGGCFREKASENSWRACNPPRYGVPGIKIGCLPYFFPYPTGLRFSSNKSSNKLPVRARVIFLWNLMMNSEKAPDARHAKTEEGGP
jgi:hypothetical protein